MTESDHRAKYDIGPMKLWKYAYLKKQKSIKSYRNKMQVSNDQI